MFPVKTNCYTDDMTAEKSRLTAKKRIGNIGESVAALFLARKGYTVIRMNYRKPWGEIDIIAERSGIVRFVEVKTVSRVTLPDVTRESDSYRPEELIHEAKLRKIARTAELYMADEKDDREYQIDAVAVFLDHRTRKARCRLYEQIL
jgi:putative endonuclease